MLNATQPEFEGIAQGITLHQFLERTREQCQRFKDLKRYPPLLLSLRKKLAEEGIHADFEMYSSLHVKLLGFSPRALHIGREILFVAVQVSSDCVEFYSPLVSYIMKFDRVETGLQLFARLKNEGLC